LKVELKLSDFHLLVGSGEKNEDEWQFPKAWEPGKRKLPHFSASISEEIDVGAEE
jgi:hypothetical protein